MAHHVNQRMWQPRSFKSAVASANAVITGPALIMAISVNYDSSNAKLTVYDALTQTGSDKIHIQNNGETSTRHDFGPVGIQFDTGVSVTFTGGGSGFFHIEYLEG